MRYDPQCPRCRQQRLIVEEITIATDAGPQTYSCNQILTPSGPAGTVVIPIIDAHNVIHNVAYWWSRLIPTRGRVRCQNCGYLYDLQHFIRC